MTSGSASQSLKARLIRTSDRVFRFLARRRRFEIFILSTVLNATSFRQLIRTLMVAKVSFRGIQLAGSRFTRS